MVLALLILGLLGCSECYGWAPATHLYYAKEVLHFSYLLPHALRALLTEFRADFLYGCVAADITIGKAYVDYIYNCHNFDVGLGLLDHTKSDSQKAFVYGYLSHLAADTVSHNFFVPYQNVEHFESPGFRHAYWEVRLDQFFGDRAWHDVEEVMANPRTHQHDQLLDGALKDTIFSFKTNRILFSGMMAIQRLRKWQQFMNGVNKMSETQFNAQHLAEYNRLAVSAIIRFLSDTKESPVYRVDPTGARVIGESQRLRKTLKQLKKTGALGKKVHEEECQKFRHYVRELYFQEYPIEDKEFHPSIHLKV